MPPTNLPIYITPEGQKKLRDELRHLWQVERPKVTSEVEAAAALGDRSENAEYQYGKKRLREIDRRLRFLAKRLENLQVVPDAVQSRSGSRVGFGAWVVIENEEAERLCYRLVGPDEFDATSGLISVESPMGKALLGKSVDDEVEVRRPKGTGYFTILKIAYGTKPDPF